MNSGCRSAQVLVAEAADDLHVAVESAHHEELLEELRTLRQGKEISRLRAAGDEEVARAPSGVLFVRNGVSSSRKPLASK